MDTNVFVALSSGDDQTLYTSQAALKEARAGEPLGIYPALCAELIAGRNAFFVKKFLLEKGIEGDWDPNREM